MHDFLAVRRGWTLGSGKFNPVMNFDQLRGAGTCSQMLICHSTGVFYDKDGSMYIKTMHDVFKENADKLEICEMLKIVSVNRSHCYCHC